MRYIISLSVGVLGLNVPTTAKVIRRQAIGLKSHPKDRRNPDSNLTPLDYKASSLSTSSPWPRGVFISLEKHIVKNVKSRITLKDFTLLLLFTETQQRIFISHTLHKDVGK